MQINNKHNLGATIMIKDKAHIITSILITRNWLQYYLWDTELEYNWYDAWQVDYFVFKWIKK